MMSADRRGSADRAPVSARMLIATRNGIFFWPGAPLAVRRGDGFLLAKHQEIVNKIACFYGPQAIYRPIVAALQSACDYLREGAVGRAQRALDRLDFPGISPNGWLVMKAIGRRLNVTLPIVHRAEQQVGSRWDTEHIEAIAALNDLWHDRAKSLEKLFTSSEAPNCNRVSQPCGCGCDRDQLTKYNFNPGELRDQRGRWAQENDSESLAYNSGSRSPFHLVQELVLPELIPRPIPIPLPSPIPYQPGLEVSPFLDVPQIDSRDGVPQNPYPDRPECVEEWEYAKEFCQDLKRRRLLGKDRYRYMGKTVWECMRGQVSQDCGGNLSGA